MKKLNIAIDGPAGAGKSTLALAVAKRYGLIYVDTGALYRAVGLYMQRNSIDRCDRAAVVSALPNVKIGVRLEDGRSVVLLDGAPVGNEIRTPLSSMYASEIAKMPEVRAFLLELQRSIARENGTVMDGRDIGTVVLPDASVKIFLTADPQARARRRFLELSQKGEACYEDVLADMKKRDDNDQTRKTAPAIPAEDAVLLDNSGLDEAQTLEKACEIIDAVLSK